MLARRTGAAHSACSLYDQIELEARVRGASPVELISILFEQADKALGRMIFAIERGAPSSVAVGQVMFVSIMNGLEGSLNHDQGGEVARAMQRAYQTIGRDVMQAVKDSNQQAIVSARAQLAGIAEAWAQVQRPQAPS